MATISSPGLGSGLDINGIISKLMQIEAQPLSKLNTQEASFQARISALGSLSGAVSALNSAIAGLVPASGQSAAAKYTSFKASLADSSIASASATSTSVAGTYSLEVTQLAKAHRITALTGLADADTAIAQGTLSIQVGTGTAKPLVVDNDNDTLGGLRDAINAGDFGVTASLVEVASGDVRLSLVSETVGAAGEITLSGLAGYAFDPSGPSGDFSQDVANGGQPAQGAIAKVNGLTVNADNNSISGAIQGVTLTLLKETTSATSVTVVHDKTTTLRTSLEAIAKAYNDFAKTAKELGSYNADTKQGGILLGDSTLRTVTQAIRSAMQEAYAGTGATRRLSDLGLAFQRDGSLSFDSSKLTGAASTDFDAVAQVASAFGSAGKEITAAMLGTGGTITAASSGAQASITALTRQRERLADRLEQIEARYRRQFTALDTLIASMNQTSSYLQRQLAALPGSNTSGSS